jgi:hypothetical protein
MPFQRAQYPANWPELAEAAKTAASWRCAGCGESPTAPYQSVAAIAAIASCFRPVTSTTIPPTPPRGSPCTARPVTCAVCRAT